MDEVQAAILKVMLTRLDSHTQRRRDIAAYYRTHIRHDLLECLPIPQGSESVWHIFPLLVAEHREKFSNYLVSEGVENSVHYPIPIPAQKALGACTIELVAPLVRTERICAQQLSLPIHPFLSDLEVRQVVEICNHWKP
jgi:dTDP-4-amino-4,6-dideoxygalactose transaminase